MGQQTCSQSVGSPPALRSTPADRHLPPFSSDELDVIVELTRGSDEDTRMVAAVVGAGLSGPEAVGAAVEVTGSGDPYVRLDGGGTRTIDPALIERMGTLSPGPVRTAGWRRFADAAAQRGVQLTQYRARDAWAARVLAAPLPAVEVLLDLKINRATIAAVAPTLELPDGETIRDMLRGEWRCEPFRNHQHRSATSTADPEVIW